MDEDASAGAELRKSLETTCGPPDGQMGHVLSALGADAARQQLIARPERSIEEHGVGRCQHSIESVGPARRGRDVGDGPAANLVLEQQPDVVLGAPRAPALQVNWPLARNRERRDRETTRLAAEARPLLEDELPPGYLSVEPLQRPVEHVAIREADPDRLRRVDREWIR